MYPEQKAITCHLHKKFPCFYTDPISPSINVETPSPANYETFASPAAAAPTTIPYNGYQVPSHKQSDIAPEYMPPPSYYECSENSNSNQLDISSLKPVVRRSSLIKN